MKPLPETQRSCTDRAGRRLLFRYSSRTASEFEERAFERHLLECDLCYSDFLAVWRVGEIVDEWVRPGEDEDGEGAPSVDSDSTQVLPDLGIPDGRPGLWAAAGWLALGLAIGFVLGATT